MLKFQAVAEKTAKNFRGLLFAAPCIIGSVGPTGLNSSGGKLCTGTESPVGDSVPVQILRGETF